MSKKEADNLLDKMLEKGEYDLALENIILDLMQIRRDLIWAETHNDISLSDAISKTIVALCDIIFRVRHKHQISKRIAEKQIKTNSDINIPSIKIEVYQQDWIPGFMAFLNNEADNYELTDLEIKPKMMINIGAFMAAVASKDIEKENLPYFIAETIMHEIIHVLEKLFKVEFNEEKIHKLINDYQTKYRNN